MSLVESMQWEVESYRCLTDESIYDAEPMAQMETGKDGQGSVTCT